MWEANHSKLVGNGSWLWGPDNFPDIPATFEVHFATPPFP